MTTLRQLWAGGCVSDARLQGDLPCPTPELCCGNAKVKRANDAPLGVEAALPRAFTQDKPKAPKPAIDWEAVLICGAVVVTFTAVMVLSAVS